MSKRTDDFAKELDAITPELIERAQGQCEAHIDRICGTGFRGVFHRHHKLRRSHGGTNDLNNLLYVCDACHRYIHDHPAMARMEGWLVRGVR